MSGSRRANANSSTGTKALIRQMFGSSLQAEICEALFDIIKDAEAPASARAAAGRTLLDAINALPPMIGAGEIASMSADEIDNEINRLSTGLAKPRDSGA